MTTQSTPSSIENELSDEIEETLSAAELSSQSSLPPNYPKSLPLPRNLSQKVARAYEVGAPFDWLFNWIFKKLTHAELKELYADVYDRWNWETGSEQDRLLMDALEREISRQVDGGVANFEQAMENLTAAFAEQMAEQIDQEVLDTLTREADGV